MFYSLQKRFLALLLLPVTVVLLIVGIGFFFYGRSYVLDQWTLMGKLRLEKTANSIKERLDAKRALIELIAQSEQVPEAKITESFLVQQLHAMPGVNFVDVQALDPKQASAEGGASSEKAVFGKDGEEVKKQPTPQPMSPMGHMRRMREMMMSRMGNMTPSPGAWLPMRGMMMRRPELTLDESGTFLSIIKYFGGTPDKPTKRIVARISFNSFMKGILEVGRWKDSYACLISQDGRYLAHTDHSMSMLTKLGETGDPVERQVLVDMRKKDFGTVFGEGVPPTVVAQYLRVPSTNWTLIMFTPGKTVLAPVMRLASVYCIAGLSALALTWLLIRWNTLPVAASIAAISEAAAKVEEGDYTVSVEETRSDEIGQLARRFNTMAHGLQQRDLIERTFGRYVDKNVAKELMSRPEALQLGGEKHPVTIMMADIRGFTKLSEHLAPDEVIRILNLHFGRMIEVIDKYRGIIVDFFGDSVLVFFNGMGADNGERASEAVSCAMEMQEAREKLNRESPDKGPALRMGIGIHTGEVVVGNIGSERRAKYGIVGSAVNETDRIQSFAEGGTVVISEQTFELVGDRVSVGARCDATLKGLEGERALYVVDRIECRDTPIGEPV